MLKILGLTLVAAVVALLAYAATRPDNFRVERRITIGASPEKVFPLINDLHQWALWSPWEKKDPDMKRTHSGPAAGPGARDAWQGNKQVGTGSMEISQASAPSQVLIKLDFFSPFEAHNIAEFNVQAQGTGAATRTEVRWAMYGPNPYVAKLMQVFFNMDSMVGKDFEAGLQNLKTLAEK